MVGIACVIPSEKKLFYLYPEVIFIDTTMDTNNEKRPLLHIAGRDPYGDTFTILRAYLPNKRTWIFRWVFNYIIPKMFGNKILKKFKL